MSVVIFFLMRLAPGDIVDVLFAAGGYVSESDKKLIMKELGIDQPIWVQYVEWLRQIFTGDLGKSFAFNVLMGRRWPPRAADWKEAETVCRELGLGAAQREGREPKLPADDKKLGFGGKAGLGGLGPAARKQAAEELGTIPRHLDERLVHQVLDRFCRLMSTTNAIRGLSAATYVKFWSGPTPTYTLPDPTAASRSRITY